MRSPATGADAAGSQGSAKPSANRRYWENNGATVPNSGFHLSLIWDLMGSMAHPQVSLQGPGQAIRLSPARAFLVYAYLQALDLLTTLAFLLARVEEANPLVRHAMAWTGSPLFGLLLVKTAALALGWVCWRTGRLRLLERANSFFAVLVAWNLVCLLLGLARAMQP
jgi:hypothetical protein